MATRIFRTQDEIDAEIARLNELRATLPVKPVWPKTTKYYLRGNKDANWDTGKTLGLSEDAIEQAFIYCCYELMLTIKVYEDGSASATHVEGVELPIPVPVAALPMVRR